MRKITIIVVSGFLLLLSSSAGATLFTFYGEDGGGAGSATMDITITGNVLTAVLDNTSPILGLDGLTDNAPGILGFGFNLSNTPSLSSWALTAFDSNGNSGTIGDGTVDDPWIMGDSRPNDIELDYLPQSSVNGNDYALYNPLFLGSPSSTNPYYTQAILTMTFSIAPELLLDPTLTNKEPSPYIRMQSVGVGGSLKLAGTPETPGPAPVPEPATMLLFGAGLAGLAGARLRKKKK